MWLMHFSSHHQCRRLGIAAYFLQFFGYSSFCFWHFLIQCLYISVCKKKIILIIFFLVSFSSFIMYFYRDLWLLLLFLLVMNGGGLVVLLHNAANNITRDEKNINKQIEHIFLCVRLQCFHCSFSSDAYIHTQSKYITIFVPFALSHNFQDFSFSH